LIYGGEQYTKNYQGNLNAIALLGVVQQKSVTPVTLVFLSKSNIAH